MDGGMEGKWLVLAQCVCSLGHEEQPVQPPPSRVLDAVAGLVCVLVVHAEHQSMRGGFSKIEPRAVLPFQAEIGTEQEKRRDDRHGSRVLDVVVAFPNSYDLFEQKVAVGCVRELTKLHRNRNTVGEQHVRLDHHVRTERYYHAVGLDGMVHVGHNLLCSLPVKDGLRRVEVGEVVVNASVDHVEREQSLRLGPRGSDAASFEAEVMLLEAMHQACSSLRLSEFRQHLCATALGTLLLWNRIIGARQAS